MKKFFKGIYTLIKSIGYARAAADLARNGKHKEAQALMTALDKCK
jgi:hypothetical protein